MSHGDVETAFSRPDGFPLAIDVGEVSPPAADTPNDRKLVLIKPLSKFTCWLIGMGLVLPFTVSIPGLEPFRKEIIGSSCLMIFMGTLVRMRLQRCRSELMQSMQGETAPSLA